MVTLFSSVLPNCVLEIYLLDGGIYWLSVLHPEAKNSIFLLNIKKKTCDVI
jgi:hypothetical protein